MSGFNNYNADGSYAQQYPKSFVATKPFNTEFFTYRVSKNARFETVGALGLVTTNATLCPIGRVLHATGKKLYPNVNPMNTFPAGSLLTGPKFLLSVYDSITMLTGFIDPTSPMFAKFDQLLANSFNLGPTANAAVYGSPAPPLGGQAGRLTIADSGTLASGTGNPNRGVGGGSVNAGSASVGQMTDITNQQYAVNTTACTATSKVFLTTVLVSGGTPPNIYTTGIFDGYFTFIMTGLNVGNQTLNWMVVN
jgi:hypothetical protein